MSKGIESRRESLQLAESYYNILCLKKRVPDYDTYVRAYVHAIHAANCYLSNGNITLEGVRTALIRKFPTTVAHVGVQNDCLRITAYPVQENHFTLARPFYLATDLPVFYMGTMPAQLNMCCDLSADKYRFSRKVLDSRFQIMNTHLYNGGYIKMDDRFEIEDIYTIRGERGVSARWVLDIYIPLSLIKQENRVEVTSLDLKTLLSWYELNIANKAVIKGDKVWYGSHNNYSEGRVESSYFGNVSSPVLVTGYCSKENLGHNAKSSFLSFNNSRVLQDFACVIAELHR